MRKPTWSFCIGLLLAAMVSQASGATSSPSHTAAGFEQEKQAIKAWQANDCARAMPMFRDLAQRNATADAQGNYAQVLAAEKCGANHAEAAIWYGRCIANNSPQIGDCLNELGLMYSHGQGVAFDEYRGEALLRRAADLGHPMARKNLQALLQAREQFNRNNQAPQAAGRPGNSAPAGNAPREVAPVKVKTCYWVSGTDGFPGHEQCS